MYAAPEVTHFVPRATPVFLRENWKKIIATVDPESYIARWCYRYVTIKNVVREITPGKPEVRSIANVTNGSIIVRSIVAPQIDGVYILDEYNNLCLDETARAGPPDFESYLPKNVTTLCEIRSYPSPTVQPGAETHTVCSIIAWLEHVRHLCLYVVMDNRGLYVPKPGDERGPRQAIYELDFPFNVTGEVLLNPSYLKLALVDMLRYDSVYLSRDEAGDKDKAPLLIGKDWDQCALVVPMT